MDKKCEALLIVPNIQIRKTFKRKATHITEEKLILPEVQCFSVIDNLSHNISPFLEDHHLSLEGNRSPAGQNLRVYSNRITNICLSNFHDNDE